MKKRDVLIYRVPINFRSKTKSIAKQLLDQGLLYDSEEIAIFQGELDAIKTLQKNHELLTDYKAELLLEALHKKLTVHIKDKNTTRRIRKPKE